MLLGFLVALAAGSMLTACSRAATDDGASRPLSKESDMDTSVFATETSPALPPIDANVPPEIATATFGLG